MLDRGVVGVLRVRAGPTNAAARPNHVGPMRVRFLMHGLTLYVPFGLSSPIFDQTRGLVPHFINTTPFAARDFWARRGASDPHTLQRSVRSEQRRLATKEPPPGGLRGFSVLASLLLGHSPTASDAPSSPLARTENRRNKRGRIYEMGYLGQAGWRLQRGPMQRLFRVVGGCPAQFLQRDRGGMPHPGFRISQGGEQGSNQPTISGAAQGLDGGEPQVGILVAEGLHQEAEGDLLPHVEGGRPGVIQLLSWDMGLIKLGHHFGGGLANPVVVALERNPQSRDGPKRLLQFFPLR